MCVQKRIMGHIYIAIVRKHVSSIRRNLCLEYILRFKHFFVFYYFDDSST